MEERLLYKAIGSDCVIRGSVFDILDLEDDVFIREKAKF